MDKILKVKSGAQSWQCRSKHNRPEAWSKMQDDRKSILLPDNIAEVQRSKIEGKGHHSHSN